MRRPETDSRRAGAAHARVWLRAVAAAPTSLPRVSGTQAWDSKRPSVACRVLWSRERVQGSDRLAASPHGRHRIVSATALSRVSIGAGPALALARACTPRRRARRGHLERCNVHAFRAFREREMNCRVCRVAGSHVFKVRVLEKKENSTKGHEDEDDISQ